MQMNHQNHKVGKVAPPIERSQMTGLVLAGGRGSRMGGVDKGLTPFLQEPLALHALRRLAPQVGPLLLSANRNLTQYRALGAAFGAAVLSDDRMDDWGDYLGPLAGFLVGLQHCQTPWLLTVPCDCPLFPYDIAARFASVAHQEQADVVMAYSLESGDTPQAQHCKHWVRQPTFCLLRTTLQPSLEAYLNGAGRKIGAWVAQQRFALAHFGNAGDDPLAFYNTNTPEQLHRLQSLQGSLSLV